MAFVQYLQIEFKISPNETEKLNAWLDHFEFEGIVEHDSGCTAYIPETIYREQGIEDQLEELGESMNLDYTTTIVESQNWNAIWESSFEPIQIDERLGIRATFHSPLKSPIEIIIDPKMSFGTGHHATTWLMASTMLSLDFAGKNILDYGCGTGVLTILAALKNARQVDAIDNNEWAFENAKENVELNNAGQVNIYLDIIQNLPPFQYDVILANINRNVILETLDEIAQRTVAGGEVLTSGYYAEDAGTIIATAATYGLLKTSQKEKDNWQCIAFQKK